MRELYARRIGIESQASTALQANLCCEGICYNEFTEYNFYRIVLFFITSPGGIPCVADLLMPTSFRWFGHLECNSMGDWVSAYQNMEIVGVNSEM